MGLSNWGNYLILPATTVESMGPTEDLSRVAGMLKMPCVNTNMD